MAPKILRGIAGVCLVLMGLFVLAGSSRPEQPSVAFLWLGSALFGALLLGGLVSAAYDVANGARNRQLRLDSLATLLVLGLGALALLLVVLFLAYYARTPLN